jgi:hypothetical protein
VGEFEGHSRVSLAEVDFGYHPPDLVVGVDSGCLVFHEHHLLGVEAVGYLPLDLPEVQELPRVSQGLQ